MALPPSGLFSLKKRPPVLRVAFSRFGSKYTHGKRAPPLAGTHAETAGEHPPSIGIKTLSSQQMGAPFMTVLSSCVGNRTTVRSDPDHNTELNSHLASGSRSRRLEARRSVLTLSLQQPLLQAQPTPDRINHEADVAQLVEQLIRNQQVNGSSPFVGSIQALNTRSANGSSPFVGSIRASTPAQCERVHSDPLRSLPHRPLLLLPPPLAVIGKPTSVEKPGWNSLTTKSID